MLKRIAPAGSLAAVVLGVVALGGCPVTQICSPTDFSCQSPCSVGDPRPQCQPVVTTGTLSVSWTVNGQAPTTGCGPANAANVRFTLAGAAPTIEPCQTGQRIFPQLSAGTIMLQAELIDAAGGVLGVYAPTAQPISAGGTTNVAIAFTTNAGANTGGARFSWTVGGQAAATACPASSQVRLESTMAPGASVTATVACTAGTAEVPGLVAGQYVFRGSLIPAGGGTPSLVENVAVTVAAGATVGVPVVDFPAPGASATGAAVVAWTVNGAQKCPVAGANMNVTVSGGPTIPSPQPTTTCGTYMLRVANLAPGNYSFNLTIPNPTVGQPAASVDIPNVMVGAGADEVVPAVDITCAFCPQ